REQHHDDMHEEEGDEAKGDKKMDRARRLASAEQVDKPWGSGIEPRRHGESGRDHQRQHDKDDRYIAEFLEDIIAGRRLAGRETQPGMVPDVAPDMARRPFGAADVQILA